MNLVPVTEYLQHATTVKPEEEIRRSKVAEWLPKEIIDCHAHCNLAEHVQFVSDRTYGHMLSTFTYFSLEDSLRLQELFYPKRTVHTLRFPKTFRGVDHRAANNYLLNESPALDRVAVFGLPEDLEYTIQVMRHPRASALKMYWSYVDPVAKRIYEFFTPEALEEAQGLGLPIILHLPRMIVHSHDDLVAMLKAFPRLKVVLAHLGLSKLPVPGLEEAYKRVAQFPNVLLDTALNPSAEVVSLALKCFGSERVMYGSDEPLNLIRSVAYRHPKKGERIVTDYPYHWTDVENQKEYGHLATNAVHAQWQCVQAIRDALTTHSPVEEERVKELIFYKTAKDFFGFE